jgi:hypothetical protein
VRGLLLPSEVPMHAPTAAPASFSGYQKLVIGMLAFLQFAVILDFMLMSPLGAIIMPALHVSPVQFGHVVSAYAFAAGISGFLTAGFADRFDRKKLLLFFYTGFMRSAMKRPPANPSTTSARNGTCQFHLPDSQMPIGRPRIWLAAKAVWMKPITRPRICGGNRSVVIASTTEPMTPPNAPATIRAASNDS